MEVTMTTLEIIEKYRAIEKLISENENLPIELAWNLEDNQEKFRYIVNKFDMHREKIISPLKNKNAFIDNSDGTMTVKDEFKNEFLQLNDEIDKLLQIKNNIEIKTCKKEILPTQIKISNLRAIKFMIVDE